MPRPFTCQNSCLSRARESKGLPRTTVQRAPTRATGIARQSISAILLGSCRFRTQRTISKKPRPGTQSTIQFVVMCYSVKVSRDVENYKMLCPVMRRAFPFFQSELFTSFPFVGARLPLQARAARRSWHLARAPGKRNELAVCGQKQRIGHTLPCALAASVGRTWEASSSAFFSAFSIRSASAKLFLICRGIVSSTV
jgi:hypothetical protein